MTDQTDQKDLPKPIVFVAVDIEKAGPDHPLIAIGCCVGTEDGTVLEKKRFTFQVKWATTDHEGDFEPHCWNAFWSTQPSSLIELLRRNALPIDRGMNQFETWLNKLEVTYDSSQYEIVFLSDNPSFDIGTIDYYLKMHCNRYPMRHTSTGMYRNILNPDDMQLMFPESVVNAYKEKYINPLVSHDHDPVNDAEVIYRQYLMVQALKQYIRAEWFQ